MLSIGGSLANASINHINKSSLDNLKAAEKLTSGIRINHAADDAAGLAVSTKLQTVLQSGQAASKGILDGINYTQVANGALSETESLLQRARELSLQSMNATYSDENRAQMNLEYKNIKEEISRISETTSFNGTFPFQAEVLHEDYFPLQSLYESFNGVTKTYPPAESPHAPYTFLSSAIAVIPQGATDIVITLNDNNDGSDNNLQVFTRDGQHVAGSPLAQHQISEIFSYVNYKILPNARYSDNNLNDGGLGYSLPATHSTKVNNTEILFSGNANYAGSPINAPNRHIEELRIDKANDDFIVLVTSSSRSGNYDITQSWSSMPENANAEWSDTYPIDILTSSDVRDDAFVSIHKTPVSLETLHLDVTNILTKEEAKNSVEMLDGAIEKITDYQVYYGAKTNVLESSFERLQIQLENVAKSKSQIFDADYAKQSANLARTQILQDSGISMLSHINQSKSDVLQLLKGITN